MITFIADLIPKLQKYSQKLDNLTLLTNQHWVIVDEIANSKTVYIFRPNNELLISKNGKVDKAKWEYLGNSTLLIDLKDGSFLFRHGFFDENVLALKIDGKNEYAFLVNETRYDKELNSSEAVLEFLQKTYLLSTEMPKIGSAFNINLTPQPTTIIPKNRKDELLEQIDDFKNSLRTNSRLIIILAIMFLATLIVSFYMFEILVFSVALGILMPIIYLLSYGTKKSLKEAEIELMGLKSEDV